MTSLLFTGLVDDGWLCYSMISLKFIYIVITICTNAGISVMPMPRTETKHPLDPLSAAEISVAVATVRAAGANPEVLFFIRRLYYVLRTF